MRERLTPGILLSDEAGRLLLMKARMVAEDGGQGAWFTVGGGAVAGESVKQGAAREVVEETGFSDVELGPVVWRREAVIAMADHDLLLKESYVVARCEGGEPSIEGWQDVERELCDEVRWWRPQDLPLAKEAVFPPGLSELLPDILAGRYPSEPMTID